VPAYDRVALRAGVVHIGVGSFHRAHQAVYFDELARRGLARDWGLVGVGLRRRAMKEALSAQDGLYTVVSRGPEGDSARVVGAITRCLFAPEETAAVLDALTDEATRIVTLTITPAGYAATTAPGRSADGRATAIGLLVEALDRRRRLGRGPFTVLSCDNTADNGEATRAAVLALARRRSERLARWIGERVTFPGSMVDRITPSTTLADRRMVERVFGIRDRWPVVTEPFSQWVIEDSFCAGRPLLEEVGAELVADVRPYALMKTRLLNAAHCALGYLGTPVGHRRTADAIADPVLSDYAERLMDDEIAPLLGVDGHVRGYAATLRARFANPAIGDPLTRLCRNGSAKVPAHVLPSIREARAAGRPHALLTLAVAAWCHHLHGDGADGRRTPLDDPDGERLRALARAGGDDPRPLLADEATFGALGRCPAFAATVTRDLRAIRKDGARAVIAARTASRALAQAA
jgi:fructuronate reductase/mannitol 2-dehydrogenase